MFTVGSRVKCQSDLYLLVYYGKVGTVVVSHAGRCKVLFDCDRVAGTITEGQNLALAHWFYSEELQEVSEEEVATAPDEDVKRGVS